MKKFHRLVILSFFFGILYISWVIPYNSSTPEQKLAGISYLDDNTLSYEIKDSSELVEFYPFGNVSIQDGGFINLTFTGEYIQWGMPDLFFDVDFILDDGSINTTALNISQNLIGMNLILGFGGFSPNIITTTLNWTELDDSALAVANAPVNEFWPSLNGDLKISSKNGVHIYDFTQNPANGTQQTYLEYDEETGILQKFICVFEDFNIHAELSPLFHSISTGISGNPIYFIGFFGSLATIFLIKKHRKI